MTRTILPGLRTGVIRIPASKSQAHRMLICAALSASPSHLILDGFSADIEATMQCLEALGARCEKNFGRTSCFTGQRLPSAGAARCRRKRIDTAVSTSSAWGTWHSGRNSDAREAPGTSSVPAVGGFGDARHAAAAGRVCPAYGRAVDRRRLFPARQCFLAVYFRAFVCAAASERKQHADGHGRAPIGAVRRHDRAGAYGSGNSYKKDGPVWQIGGEQRYAAPSVQTVEGDWSNAAFFLCMGALSEAGVTVTGLNPESLQADRAITEILTRFGAKLAISEHAVIVRRGNLHGITLDAGPVPDLIPVVSCLAALCSGETQIENAARLRLKESDRLQTTAALLSVLGGCVHELPDGLVILGRDRLSGGTADACGDHRIAMSAAMAACGCEGLVTVSGSECVAKSYPAFWEDFASLKEDAV